MKKSAIYLSIEMRLKEALLSQAEREHRSLANMLEWILIQYFRKTGGGPHRKGGGK